MIYKNWEILPSQPLAHNANPARYAAARKITHINF